MFNSYSSFLKILPKKYFIFVVFLIILMTFIIYILIKKDSYDVYKYFALINCSSDVCQVSMNVAVDEVELINSGKYLVVSKNKYTYKVKSIGEVEVDYNTLINFQRIELDFNLPKDFQKNNLVIEIFIYTNKEKLIKKISKKFI